MTRDPAEALSEATRLAILQGRFEAIHLGARQVEPHHLLLGLLKTMPAPDLDPATRDALLAQLGASPDPAPLSPGDIDYAESCFQAIGHAIDRADGAMVEPAALLLILRDRRP